MGVERERLLARTRDAVTKGLAAGNMWHAASNAEHARPMLQVRPPSSGWQSLKAWACAQAGANGLVSRGIPGFVTQGCGAGAPWAFPVKHACTQGEIGVGLGQHSLPQMADEPCRHFGGEAT